MNLVIVGHVDHGKSTFIGRLLADTGSLPDGKLEQVKAVCEKNAKPFEYAFLLDALKDEQSQGITIDAARCFFKTSQRHYIVIDAPGHVEFLKNMITGAARAEAALLLIDAKEGVQENSRRHGYMLSLLGIKQVLVLVNKMDLVGYNEVTFNTVKTHYSEFLKEISIDPIAYIPIAAFHGDNLVTLSSKMPWYQGKAVIQEIDAFKKEAEKTHKPFRFPVQDVYKFTEHADDRRILSGQIYSGSVSVGDDVVFLPSQKQSAIRSIEEFNKAPSSQKKAGQHAGFTLKTQLYVKPGELMCKVSDPLPLCGKTMKVNLFWLGKTPMMKNKKYKLKLASSRETVYLKEVLSVLDASTLEKKDHPTQINRLDVAQCILQLIKPLAFDTTDQEESTSRFVIVDGHDIAGGGIVTEALKDDSLFSVHSFEKSDIKPIQRAKRFNQHPMLIVLTGNPSSETVLLSKTLEKTLFNADKNVYYLGLSAQSNASFSEDRQDRLSRFLEMAHFFVQSGAIFITSIPDLDDKDVKFIQDHHDHFLLISLGSCFFRYTHVDFHLDQITNLPQHMADILALIQSRSQREDFNI